jgi:uncharacterized radical SAM superfamily protein
MPSVDTPTKLKDFSLKLEKEGGKGILVSGGSTLEGRIPFERFYKTLKWIKENTELIVEVHTGLLNSKQAEEIASTGIDIASIDLVGSDETIKRVYGLKAKVEDYWATIKALKEAGIPHIAPHICIGLDYGQIKGEYTALEIAASIDPEILVLLGLIPTVLTPMADVSPPLIKDFTKIIASAKQICSKSDIALGCMRSREYKIEMEKLAIDEGINRITLPSQKTIEYALKKGYNYKVIDGCCAIPRSIEDRLLRC